MSEEQTVFLVDDEWAVRSGLGFVIGSVGIQVRAYESCEDFLEAYDGGESGCLVLDVRMRGMSGLELQQELRSRDWTIPVIVITGHGDVPMAVEAMQQGAVDFLEKPIREQVLLDSIQKAFALDAKHREREARSAELSEKVASLTLRERQVMGLVVEGKANKVIAMDLGVSAKTVEFHRANLMRKMRVESLAELVLQLSQMAQIEELEN